MGLSTSKSTSRYSHMSVQILNRKYDINLKELN
jgi:hypothetical protein